MGSLGPGARERRTPPAPTIFAAPQGVLRCEYFGFLNFGVLNLNRIRQRFLGLWLSLALNAISAATRILERMGVKLTPNKITSPYAICVSTKTTSSGVLVFLR